MGGPILTLLFISLRNKAVTKKAILYYDYGMIILK